ncbi:MAG TPA: hypothetical protein VFK30_06275, partial [Anaerolineae bacterium]|nr:hypothetical protein [Anaerolineae bacterium]
DQAWISQTFNGEATWSAADGVLSWRFEVQKNPILPDTARLIFFHGREKPWMLPRHPIVKEHWH